ncbi:hypothetical protein JNW89_24805, partial [Micromonospora sp. 4G55]|nr:hypothetical protein [Micromonospora sp. 4G55]
MRGIAGSGLHEPPFPGRRHPATGQVAAESLSWARSLELVADGPRWDRLLAAEAPNSPAGPAHGRRWTGYAAHRPDHLAV